MAALFGERCHTGSDLSATCILGAFALEITADELAREGYQIAPKATVSHTSATSATSSTESAQPVRDASSGAAVEHESFVGRAVVGGVAHRVIAVVSALA